MPQTANSKQKQTQMRLQQIQFQDQSNAPLHTPHIFAKRVGQSQAQAQAATKRRNSNAQARRTQSPTRPSQLLQMQSSTNTSRLNQPFMFAKRTPKVQAQVLQNTYFNTNSTPQSAQSSRSSQSSQSSKTLNARRQAFAQTRVQTRPQTQTQTQVQKAQAQVQKAQAQVKKAQALVNAQAQNATYSPTVKNAWSNSAQKRQVSPNSQSQVESKELKEYLHVLNCRYPGHPQEFCENPPQFHDNIAYWGKRLRADYPPYTFGPQGQVTNTNASKFTDSYMVKKFGQVLKGAKTRKGNAYNGTKAQQAQERNKRYVQ